VGSDNHLVVAEIQLQTADHQNNSSPAQFTVAQFTAGTIHRGTIHQAKFTAQFIVARFPAHNSPRINHHEKIKNPAG
jgi:hypothetical protein